MFFAPIPNVHYRSCSLSEGKEWYVFFYVQDPATGKLRRIRIKVNRIKNQRERRRAAREMMAAIDQRLAMGWNPLLEAHAPRAYETLFAAMDSFLETKRREMEQNSMRSYSSFVKTFRAWLQNHGITEKSYACVVTKEVASSFMEEMELSLSIRTYNNYVAFYRLLFSWMKGKGFIDINPFEGIRKKSRRKTTKNRRMLSDAELSTLISWLTTQDPVYKAMCMLCYCCFLRPKEIVLLRCEDLDLERQLLHVKADVAKNDNDSYRTIPAELLPSLRSLDLSQARHYLFGRPDFRPSTRAICSREIARWWDLHVRPACGFDKDLKFYSLKDTGITNMLSSGVPVNLVQQQADHSNVAITSIYLGKKPEADAKIRSAAILPR